MRLSGRCCKCGSYCTPRWQKATDRMRYSCVCGYEWSSVPLDSAGDGLDRLKEFQRMYKRIEDEMTKFEPESKRPLKVMLTNGTGRGEINFQ